MQQLILASRKNAASVDLSKFYTGDEAAKIGLIDGIGRIHHTIPTLVENAHIQMIRKNRIDEVIKDLKKIELKK